MSPLNNYLLAMFLALGVCVFGFHLLLMLLDFFEVYDEEAQPKDGDDDDWY